MPRGRKRWRGIKKDRRAKLIPRLIERDGLDCHICGYPMDPRIIDFDHAEFITLDHVIPISDGGPHEMENLALAHQWCNNRRGNSPKGLAIRPKT